MRVPEDVRFAREYIRQNHKEEWKCLYIGFATGQDFYSWYPMGMGFTKVDWDACDIKSYYHEGCNYILKDYKSIVEGNKYDIIVCNYVFNKDNHNILPLIKNNPPLIFCRDHQHTIEELKQKLPNYYIYEHLNQYDVDTDGCKMRNHSYIWLRDDFAPPVDKYIKLKRV